MKVNEVKDFYEKYGDYEIDHDALMKIIKKPKPKTVWELEKDDVYYVITCGSISTYCWEEDVIDKSLRELGDCFLTREEAEFELEKRKIETILLKYSTHIPPKDGKEKFTIGFDACLSYCSTHSNNKLQPNNFYFDSVEDIKNAVNEAGIENVEKYLFGL